MAVKVLLDTSWAVRYLRGQPEIVARLEELRPEGLGISRKSDFLKSLGGYEIVS